MASASIKSKIVPGKDLGNPSAVKSLPDGQNRLKMGVVFGEITKVVTRTMPTGEIYEGFGGTFEARPDDPKFPTVQSGVLYLPAGFDEILRDPFKTAQAEDANARMTFGFEVWSVRAQNPAGYSWEYVPLGEPAKADPLATLRQQIMGSATPQLAAPEPEKKRAGGKR